jgi:cobalt-zinc-cadmium efflux system membrane fusion protein
MNHIIKYISAALLLVFTACSHHEAHDKEASNEKPGTKEAKALIPFTKKQFDAIGIQLGTFSQKNLATTIKTNGTLELPPQNKADVNAYTEGIVSRILVTQGQSVKKGQTLAYISHPEIIDLQQEYLEANSQLQYMEKEYNRQKELKENDVTSVKVFQKTQADYRELISKTNGLRSQLMLLHLDPVQVAAGKISQEAPVTAPIEGNIASINVNIGSSFSTSDKLFEIIDYRHIYVALLVYEQDIYKIHEGQKVQFMLSNYAGKTFTATIFSVGKVFEKDIKAVKVYASIENTNGTLLPGTYIDARIQINDQYVNALPDDAIVKEGEHKHIFVLANSASDKNNYYFDKVEVKTGASDAGYTEVIPFRVIKPNEKIAVKGAYYISAQSKAGEGGEDD